jgi:RNA polymerase sigma factor (sigma-70 family)
LCSDARSVQSQASARLWAAEHETMTTEANYEQEKARRFRDDALLHLDDVFALARYLLRNAEDAEDAVQECYLRALRHFDSYHGPAMKPWLLAIVRNVCNARFARLAKQEISTDFSEGDSQPEQIPIWQENSPSPEATLIRQHDDDTIRRLVAALPHAFREAIVLREVNNLSYQEIAKIVGVPVGTVMSRLSRGRSMLRSAWNVAEGAIP